MCGIFGCLNFNINQLDKARNSLHKLEHRGRDQWGDWYNSQAYIGHRRLSIIDLSDNGKQPFVQNDIILAVNGEIYNYLQLKKELKNFKFRSESDSEVILHGYRAWGMDKLLNKLDGMYAFALYDTAKEYLYIVKDRWGKKPLFWSKIDNQVIFGSEIKALFEFNSKLKVFDYQGIKHWIQYRGSHNSKTIFYNINRIQPGTYLKITKDLKLTSTKYYSILNSADEQDIQISLTDFDDKIKSILKTSVNKRLMSDVPLGLQLSGGVDSSLIASVMNEQNVSNINSFSVNFGESKYSGYSEENYSNFVSNKFNFIHHDFKITTEKIRDNYLNTLYIFDGMLDYPNAIALYLLNSYSKEYISVSLTGEAADELFGGYRKFLQVAKMKNKSAYASFTPDLLFRFALGEKINMNILRILYLQKQFAGNHQRIISELNSYISSETMDYIFGDSRHNFLPLDDLDKLQDFSLEKQALLADHMTYLYSLLDRQDRTSMGANVEARLPFIDKELVEWIIKLRPDLLFNNNENKIPLKRISESVFGNDFTYRKKMGFPLPLNNWIHDENCFIPYYKKVFEDDFLLYNMISRKKLVNWLESNRFSNKLLNYSDSEKMWMKWFLMVIRNTQDLFEITNIK